MGEDRIFEKIREAAGWERGAKALLVPSEISPCGALTSSMQRAGLRITALACPGVELRHPHRVLPMDITHLSFSDQCFDLIWAPEVLSRVRSDYQALWEVQRCLRGNGVAVLTVKIEGDKTERLEEGQHPEGRLWRYGYDFFGRLHAAGFFALRFEDHILGFKYRETRDRFQNRFFPKDQAGPAEAEVGAG